MMFSFFGAQNHAEDDVTPQGGSIDLTKKMEFSQWSATDQVALVSDGPDVRTGIVTGRVLDKSIETEIFTLNGPNEVVLTKIWERLLKVTLSTTDSRNVSVRQGAGGPTQMLLGPGIIESRMTFIDSYSTALTSVKRYEKIFLKTDQAVSNVNLTLTSDPDARIQVGIALTVNDSELVATRLTAPASVVFIDDNISILLPDLLAGEAIGIWIRQQLLMNDPDHKSSYMFSVVGTP